MAKSEPFSIRLSPDGEKSIKRIIKEQFRPGLTITRNQAIDIALAMYVGAGRCPECTAPLEEITLAEDGSPTGFFKCPTCTTGDEFKINPA